MRANLSSQGLSTQTYTRTISGYATQPKDTNTLHRRLKELCVMQKPTQTKDTSLNQRHTQQGKHRRDTQRHWGEPHHPKETSDTQGEVTHHERVLAKEKDRLG